MHRTIGIVGGMTPESTIIYYLHITRTYQERFGDYGFPAVIIHSVSFQSMVNWMNEAKWNRITAVLSEAVQALHRAGAELAVIATNTMHYVFPAVQSASPIPMISIIDCTAQEVKRLGIKTVGLLGTRFTMEKPFYRDGLSQNHITTLIPDPDDRQILHTIIFDELGKNIIRKESKHRYIGIIEKLKRSGAEGIILGCTEIPLLIHNEDCDIPLLNTALLHAESALTASISVS